MWFFCYPIVIIIKTIIIKAMLSMIETYISSFTFLVKNYL